MKKSWPGGFREFAVLWVLVAVAVSAYSLRNELAAGRFDLNDSVFHYTLIDRTVQSIEIGENPLDHWVSEWTLGYAVPRTYPILGHLCVAFLYFALFRNWLKSKLQVKNQPSNVDAVIGRTGVVTKRIAPQDCGLVKIGSEEWRAELAQPDGAALELGAEIKVLSVEGVTLKVG